MDQCQGPRTQIRLFFGLHLCLAGKYCKNPRVPGAQLNVNPARAITWFVGVTIYCTFFNNNSPPPRQFLCNKVLSKKISYRKGNAHWTNCWIERAWAPCPYMYQKWKPVGSTGTGRVDRPVGSRFFHWPVKPVETSVKFSFLATKKHLSTNRNIHIYFIIHKLKKKNFNKPPFWNHFLNDFKLWLICCHL